MARSENGTTLISGTAIGMTVTNRISWKMNLVDDRELFLASGLVETSCDVQRESSGHRGAGVLALFQLLCAVRGGTAPQWPSQHNGSVEHALTCLHVLMAVSSFAICEYWSLSLIRVVIDDE